MNTRICGWVKTTVEKRIETVEVREGAGLH